MSSPVCVLTGATGGIGRAIALRLAKEGWRVLLVGRNIKQLAALQLECGNDAEYFQADLSNSESRNDLAKFAQQIGGATLLINNAGVNVMQGFSEISEQQIDHLLNINLNVPIKLCQLFLPQITRNKGTIVNIGSSFGSIGYPYQTLYCASKFGLRGMTEALARELSHSDVKVLYLAPRATDTAINSPQVRAMNKELGNTMDPPEKVADALIDLIKSKKRRRFIGFPETLFARINGAFPSLVDNAIAKQLPKIKSFFAN
ncbi:SDR family oxidoreductase [Pseudoalteromonas sp. SSMSWG5]|jgi:short-subunit dehydrogenase|uniref:SDR family oxidoreductase n=1 Tax=Pseudoalteromonas TaxID=53246 RepID=UPI000EC77CA8|nr:MULTISPECIES: SDR family oxidoreductase [unclassified Pseudoalteromonas]HCV02487.1 short chain dehydrogenase [Pseudoalteromonas sp.]MCF2903170.1 SDR family oxidoreductase [Pseudoalteromonas sp. OFAV1]MCF2921703.1 SDR family oxidoreductase [Pseudoalteromonas sp. APAL1]MCO7251930.1 SDR family oxidoreductase [Pseudoalteromonas sp. Ps84H-4]TGV17334.1 SDR family oxidoreductase [Pseudoalteromonas sp. MEBiC 03607]|tara:strand:- start:196 stop:972 length:777 start_codon:yes stop_codon:yes gene_type:complete